jgi:putative transposase
MTANRPHTEILTVPPRRRRLPPDLGERQVAAVAPNVLDRTFEAPAPNRKWIADFTYVWTAEGWLYVAVVIDLFSRRVVGWSMSAEMTAQFVTDAPVIAIWRRGKSWRAGTCAAGTPTAWRSWRSVPCASTA